MASERDQIVEQIDQALADARHVWQKNNELLAAAATLGSSVLDTAVQDATLAQAGFLADQMRALQAARDFISLPEKLPHDWKARYDRSQLTGWTCQTCLLPHDVGPTAPPAGPCPARRR